MPGAITRWGAIGAAALALLAVPATASAKRIFDIDHRGLAVRMSLRGSHGYRVKIENVRGKVKLTASRDGLLAAYEVPGRVTRHGLRANFGRFGRVAVRFRRIGKSKISKPPLNILRCKGRNPIREHGRFEGTIRFHGEEGYTAVSASGAKGSVTVLFKRRCGFGGKGHHRPWARAAARKPEASFLGTALQVENEEAGRTTSLSIFSAEVKARKHERGLFLSFIAAGTSERRGRMTLEKAVLTEGDEGSVLASPFGVQPVTATVSLPRPFAGTGSYLEQPGSAPSWTGTLHVRLPGADVPLTGPGFTADLCRARNPDRFDACLR
jgi:hypothetical protein